MKRYINSKSHGTLRHLFLLVLFAFLPFIFSDKLIETETTFRFIISGVVLSVFFVLILIDLMKHADLALPSIKKNRFYLLLLLYMIFMVLTTTASLNKGEAIYDYLKICTLAGYFFLFVFFLKNTDDFLPLLLKYSNVSIWIFTLITLSQIGLQLQTAKSVKIDYMLSSSLGNKNFYAETLVLFLPLILMGMALLRGRWRVISAINMILIAISLVALQTLSTWLAIAVFVLFASGIIIYMSVRKMPPVIPQAGSRRILILTPVLIIALAIPLLYHINQFNLIQRRIDKVTEYAQSDRSYTNEDTYHTNSIAERIFLWKNAWRMFKDYPLAGAGFGNWKIYNTKYELPFSKYIMSNNVRYIRPHNDLLLILAEGGIIGFVLFTGLFAYAFFLFFRLLSADVSPERRITLLLAASGLVIYLIIACVSLPGDRFYTQLLLFLFFAVICATYEVQESPAGGGGRKLIMVFCLVSIISGTSITYIGARRYASEVHLIYALQAQIKKDWQKMGYHAAMAKNYFFPIDYTATPIAWYQGMAAFRSGSPTISKYYFEEALRSNPYDLNVINDLATCIQREGDNDKAMKLYDQALGMAPFFSDAFMNKVILLYTMGKRDSAYRYLHTYPRYHADDEYNRILTVMCTNKAIEAIGDTTLSRHYLHKKINLLRMDSIATADHIPVEQLILRDTMLTDMK